MHLGGHRTNEKIPVTIKNWKGKEYTRKND